MADNERDFKGVWIPKEVWLDERLNMLEKGILTEIDSLDNEKGCFASNKHIANFCQCSETKVSTAISKLIDLGYLYVQSFDGRQRILKSRLSKFERQNYKKRKADIQNVKHSNIYNNTDNKTNNNNNIKSGSPDNAPLVKEIIEYLNSILGTKFSYKTAKTQRDIKARLNENDYTLEDFKLVIDKKYKEWKGTEFEKYLRPETLFGTKFESYLNQKEVVKKTTTTATTTQQEQEKDKWDKLFGKTGWVV